MTGGRSLPRAAWSAPRRTVPVLSRRLVIVATLALCCISLLSGVDAGAAGGADSAPGGSVLVTSVDDPITPVIADHLGEAVDEAERDGHRALIVELDTPGGLSTSMRDIVQDFLSADVPIVVHVTPSGARAASAGALITWSAHVAAMAPGTTIGAATPVDLEGGEVADKVVEDAAAYARAVAQERGRNVDLAAEAVTEGLAFPAREALEEGLADVEADSRAELLAAIDGRDVELRDRRVTIDTDGVEVVEKNMTFLRTVLQFLADPNVAFLFFSIGSLGIIYELATPGIGAGGGLGALLLILGLVSLSVLPVDAAGLLFFVLAGALFVAELFAPGVGIAAGLGSVTLVLAGVFTFRDDTPGLSVSLAAIVPVAAVVGIAVIGAGRLALRAAGPAPVSGASRLVGQETVVEQKADGPAQGRLQGSWWRLHSDAPLTAGQRVRVTAVDGVDLIVEPATELKEHP